MYALYIYTYTHTQIYTPHRHKNELETVSDVVCGHPIYDKMQRQTPLYKYDISITIVINIRQNEHKLSLHSDRRAIGLLRLKLRTIVPIDIYWSEALSYMLECHVWSL